MNKDILSESFKDLREDLKELIFLSDSAIARIDKFISELNKQKKHIKKNTFELVIKEAGRINNKLDVISKEITKYSKQAQNPDLTEQFLTDLTQEKDNLFDQIRTIYGLAGSIITSTDWQSPTSSYSVNSEAGCQTGKIKNTFTDYKRDIHLDEYPYERDFSTEYIDSFIKYDIRVLLTSSGMSAFTTILNFLMGEGKIKGKIIAGISSYFQYKQLLSGILEDKIIWIDEMKTDEIIETVNKYKPDAIFLDSLCNAASIPVPNLKVLINYLIKTCNKDTYLVIDNSCMSASFQPMKLIKGKSKKVHLLVFESLMKYHHFGLDRATGGIIYAWGKNTDKLYDYRKNSGTNIADSSVYLFPTPTKNMLQQRISRFQRNAYFLALSLQEYIVNKKDTAIANIFYPGLTDHPAYPWTKNMSFQGSFLNLEFKKKNINTYKKFLKIVINEAKKRNIQLVVGTSFGLNHTRVYLTSLWTSQGDPFIRIAAGTENRWQLEILKEVFKSSIDKI